MFSRNGHNYTSYPICPFRTRSAFVTASAKGTRWRWYHVTSNTRSREAVLHSSSSLSLRTVALGTQHHSGKQPRPQREVTCRCSSWEPDSVQLTSSISCQTWEGGSRSACSPWNTQNENHPAETSQPPGSGDIMITNSHLLHSTMLVVVC